VQKGLSLLHRKIGLAIANRRGEAGVSVAFYSGMLMTTPSDWPARARLPERHRAEPRDIWMARRFIEEHATEELSLGKVAKAVGINPTHLSEKFKQVTGAKFVDYIARTRFEKARKLLEDVDLRTSEIAFAAGFQSLSQFNRVFKKLSGKSPTTYRMTHLRRKHH
jgi:Response regulator containing CheY-like receiver domain and AraC-type DNA-binding domain